MSAEDAVFVAANAREEVRKSLDRMQYHLGRGTKGLRGVAREVDYLDALSRQAARLGQSTAGATRMARGNQGLGTKALDALSKPGNTAYIGRTKSSLLAGFSDDVMWGAREWTYTEGRTVWVWVTNGSACAACLANHGSTFQTYFSPEHPSCLCYPERVSVARENGVTRLDDDTLLNVMRTSNNPRWRAQAQLVDNGTLSVRDAIQLNRRPATAAKYRADALARLQRGGPPASQRLITPTGRAVQPTQPTATVQPEVPAQAQSVASVADDLKWQSDDFVPFDSTDLDEIEAILTRYKLENLNDIPKSATGGDEALENIWRKRGNYHNKPTIVDDIDEVKGAFDDEVLLRGVPKREHLDDFMRAEEHRGGYGIYGNGTYTAMERGTQVQMQGFQNLTGMQTATAYSEHSGNIMAIKLKPGARVADYNKIDDAKHAIRNQLRDRDVDSGVSEVAWDVGHLASALGYDAILVPGSNYVVILNRGATYVSENIPKRLTS